MSTKTMQPQELKVYQLLRRKGEDGASAQTIAEELVIPVQQLVTIINKLLRTSLVEMRIDEDTELTYHALELLPEHNKLNEEEMMVLKVIRHSGTQGIWTKYIKMKTNLHQTALTRVYKSLESKNLIKAVKPVQNPTRKTYMLFELEPSQEITGGPWFTDQTLDSDFVEQLTLVAYRYILSRSYPKNSATAIYSASHPNYPNAKQIHNFVIESKITDTRLEPSDIDSLLDLLIFDGKIERKVIATHGGKQGNDSENETENEEEKDEEDEEDDDSQVVYKALREPQGDDYYVGNAWTDMPCGRCPIFNYCSEDGVVSPKSCLYFKKWLVDQLDF
ncbi:hypothetical protein G9A89_011629 [Geosiphon pyriformis]|nr:hypothetical protein G9A89_011629 [Geosiphon pyriformis]